MMLKKWICSILLGVSLSANTMAMSIDDAVNAYLNNPTEENADQAAKIAGKLGISADLGSSDLLLIRNQIVAGSVGSLRLVLTMLSRADGGNLENLMALAAASIRPQPTLFLTLVLSEKLSRQTLNAILLMPGPEYVDRPVAKEFELSMRRRAIESVTGKNLAEIRNKCLKALRAKS